MAESRASIVFGRWGFKTVRPYLTQLLVTIGLESVGMRNLESVEDSFNANPCVNLESRTHTSIINTPRPPSAVRHQTSDSRHHQIRSQHFDFMHRVGSIWLYVLVHNIYIRSQFTIVDVAIISQNYA